MVKKRFLIKALKLLFVASIITSFALFINATDISRVIASLRLVGANFILLLFTTFVSYLLGTVASWFCLGTDRGQLSIGRLFIIRHLSETVALLNPASVVGGEAVKVALLTSEGIARTPAITSAIVSRALMVVTQLVLFTVAAGIFLFKSESIIVGSLPVLNIVAAIAVAIVSIVLIFKSRVLHNVFSKIAWPTRFVTSLQQPKIKLKALTHEFSRFLHTNKSDLAWAFLFLLLHWIVGSVEFYLILKFLGLNVTIADGLFMDMGVIFFKTAGAFVPAQVGFEEYGNKIMLSLIGIGGDEIWLTVSVLRRLRQLFWILLGILFYALMHKKYRNIFVSN